MGSDDAANGAVGDYTIDWTVTDADNDATVTIWYKETNSGACNTGTQLGGNFLESVATDYAWTAL